VSRRHQLLIAVVLAVTACTRVNPFAADAATADAPLADGGDPVADDASTDGSGLVDAATDADPSADFDGDGIVDIADNCSQVGNPDQRNEDADEWGDVCDNCPHLSQMNQANDDSDGLGDDCDDWRPQNDQILRFIPLSSLPADMSLDSDLSLDPSNGWIERSDFSGGYRYVTLNGSYDRVTVVIGGQITGVDTGDDREIGICAAYDGSVCELCRIFDDAPSLHQTQLVSFESSSTQTVRIAENRIADMAAGTTFKIEFTVVPGLTRCNADVAGAEVDVAYPSAAFLPGAIRLVTDDLGLHIDYLLVIQHPPA
jgi:hypothetical protein